MGAIDEGGAPRRRRSRYLVAIVLEGSVAIEVEGLRRAVQGWLVPQAAPQLAPHITLVAPLNVPKGDVPAALSVLGDAASACVPLELHLGPPGAFPGRGVLYLGVSGDLEGLGALRDELSRAPLEPPRMREERAFVPHVTLGNGLEAGRAATLADLLGNYHAEVTARSVSLFEAEVTSGGTEGWTEVAEEVLGGRSVRGRGGLEVVVSLSGRLDPLTARFAAEEWAAYGRAIYRSDWEPDRPFVFVARQEGLIAGLVTGVKRGRTVDADRLIVASTKRGLGTGSRLLEAVERLGREQACERIRLRTIAGGPAEGFYTRRGFVRTGRLDDWREGRDFVVMERSLL